MTESRVRLLLIATIVIMSALPASGAFYLLDRAVETSLNLGFNEQIDEGLDIGMDSLKTLRRLDPIHQEDYRSRFDVLVDLKRVYSQPDWLKGNILRPLRIYFGLGLLILVLLAAAIAMLLSRQITRAYGSMLSELLAQRERVHDLRQMASWQELARVLAHEIKNPLTPVEVLLSSLGRAYSEKEPSDFARQLNETQRMIAEELGHLKRTVARFSEFARLPRAELIEVAPAEVIRRHLPALGATFPETTIHLDTDQCSPIAFARMDASLVRQVLMNIVNNGVEANSGESVCFKIQVHSTPKSIDIVISNDGIPVPTSIADQLFEPYVSQRRLKENMGMGLAIVKKIVIEHGGSIRYAEEDNHPAFIISLPRTR